MSMPAEESTFVISLDFELHWGGFEKWPILLEKMGSGESSSKLYNQYFLNTREIIPRILMLFEKYEVHATWASVGMLMHESKETLLSNSPQLKPTYVADKFSAYNYIDKNDIGECEYSDPFHFAPTLIRKILETPHQELGTHTFSHFYCNEEGQTPEQFRSDLQAAKRVAANYGVRLQSLIFPRNQFSESYLKICFEEGIKFVRSNPSDWFWKIKNSQRESKWKRLHRGLDAYFPIGKKNSYKLNELIQIDGFPIRLPASRLLRPYRPMELLLNGLKIERIISEITYTAKNNEIYHLWWHPHNFGSYPYESLKGLERILKHYAHCRQKYGMCSMTMAETGALITRDG